MMAEDGILIVDDAGITRDGCRIDTSVAAQKGHLIWEFLRTCGVRPTVLETTFGHGTQLKIAMTRENLAKIERGFGANNRQPKHLIPISGLGDDAVSRSLPGNTQKTIVWVRTDSIGDAVLSASMLPYIRRKYEGARIVIVCQEHIAELYEACPYVDEVVVFNRARALEDERYRLEITARLRMLKPQLSLNSVYSREALTDWFAIKCGAERRVALEGNLCNISPQRRSMHNQFYTDLLASPGGHKLELERHRDFLRGLDIEAPGLQPVVWMKQEDEAFADRLFGENGLDPAGTIALFAGAQYDCRVYEGYGRALSEFCRANRLTVIALGTEQDRDINQRNLNAIGVRTINLSGGTTILQSCAILKRCRLAVGAETGLAHICCAVGTPNVILLGGGHFGRFMPYSPLTSLACLPLEC
jgi:ADP-heptose:LPS heptosyltransferase